MPTSTPTNIVRPTADWTLDRLERYALARAEEIGGFGRKTIVQTWLFGEALSYIQETKKKDKTWIEWVKTQPFSHSTATSAIKLCKGIDFDDLESCKGMTVSDLKASMGIIQEIPVKKRGKQTPAQTANIAHDQISRHTPTSASSKTTKACDRKLAETPSLSVFNGGSQDDEQTTDDPQVDQPEVSAAPQRDTPEHADAAKTETPAQNITSLTALAYLHRINMKLAELERDLEGVQPDEHLIAQINKAIHTLMRLRGDAGCRYRSGSAPLFRSRAQHLSGCGANRLAPSCAVARCRASSPAGQASSPSRRRETTSRGHRGLSSSAQGISWWTFSHSVTAASKRLKPVAAAYRSR